MSATPTTVTGLRARLNRRNYAAQGADKRLNLAIVLDTLVRIGRSQPPRAAPHDLYAAKTVDFLGAAGLVLVSGRRDPTLTAAGAAVCAEIGALP